MTFPPTLRSSLRSDTSNKVRLAMSLTSCWILGEYCLGAPSNAGVAMASECVAGLVFRSLRAHRAGAGRWSCCLENKKWINCGPQSSRYKTQFTASAVFLNVSGYLFGETAKIALKSVYSSHLVPHIPILDMLSNVYLMDVFTFTMYKWPVNSKLDKVTGYIII